MLNQNPEGRNVRTSILTIAASLVMTLGIGAASADTLADVKAKGTLTIGVKNDYPPYGFLNDKGEIVGFEVDLGKYIAKELLGPEGKVELVPVVAANRIEFLNSGRIDIILATLGVTEERGKVVDFSEYYVSAPGPRSSPPRRRPSANGRSSRASRSAASRAPTTTST